MYFEYPNCQLFETIKLWYLYKNKIKGNLGWSNFHLQDPIWWNKDVRLKSKKFFFYPVWDEKGIRHISDLFLGQNFVKTFEDLVVEFDIPVSDRRKYNSLMNGIYLQWFQNSKNIQENVFDKICSSLVSEKKVPKHVCSILRNQASVEVENKWIDCLDVVDEVEWNYIHNANFKCTIETQMRSFYFKLFHKAICLINFSIELVDPILPTVIFVIIYQKLFCTYFANVKKFPPF